MTGSHPSRRQALIDVLAQAWALLDELGEAAQAELVSMTAIPGENRHSRRIDRIAREALRLVRISNKAQSLLKDYEKAKILVEKRAKQSNPTEAISDAGSRRCAAELTSRRTAARRGRATRQFQRAQTWPHDARGARRLVAAAETAARHSRRCAGIASGVGRARRGVTGLGLTRAPPIARVQNPCQTIPIAMLRRNLSGPPGGSAPSRQPPDFRTPCSRRS